MARTFVVTLLVLFPDTGSFGDVKLTSVQPAREMDCFADDRRRLNGVP
jgi:hypothetical protein